MALFMDVHRNVENIPREKIDEAHKKDLAVQGKHGVEITDYWHSEKDGAVFCLAEAPSKEAFGAVHREAHGLEADEIFEVTNDLVSNWEKYALIVSHTIPFDNVAEALEMASTAGAADKVVVRFP